MIPRPDRVDQPGSRISTSVPRPGVERRSKRPPGARAGGSERRAEAGLLEHVRIQLEARPAKPRDRRLAARVGSRERDAAPPSRAPLEVVTRGERVLDRLVVEALGQRPPLAL